MEPLSLLTVAVAALISSAAKSVVKDLWEKKIRSRLTHVSELKVVMPSGEVIHLDQLTKEKVEQLVKAAQVPKP